MSTEYLIRVSLFKHITLHIWGAGLLAILARSASQRVCVPMSVANEHNVFVSYHVYRTERLLLIDMGLE